MEAGTLLNLISILISSILMAGFYASMACGLALIFGVMGVINLAHAGLITLAAYLTFQVSESSGVDPFLLIFLIMPLFFFLGMILQKSMVKRVAPAEKGPTASLLLLFGVWLILQNIAYWAWGGDPRSILRPYSFYSFQIGAVKVPFIRTIVFASGIASLLCLHQFLKRTFIGKAIRAVSQNRQACALVGINVEKTSSLAFGIGIAFCGLAGVFVSVLYAFTPDFGREILLKSFAIVILGGLQSFQGAILGGLALATVESWSIYFIEASYQPAIAFALLVVALILMPTGFMGIIEKRRRK